MLTFQKPLMLCHMPSYSPDYIVMVFVTVLYFGSFFSCGREIMCTKVGLELTDVAELFSGIVQGSGLGPATLILAYINELATILRKHGISVHVFADDVKIYLKILNAIDIDQLQGALNDLVQWAHLWQLSLSIDKCCVLKSQHWNT